MNATAVAAAEDESDDDDHDDDDGGGDDDDDGGGGGDGGGDDDGDDDEGGDDNTDLETTDDHVDSFVKLSTDSATTQLRVEVDTETAQCYTPDTNTCSTLGLHSVS